MKLNNPFEKFSNNRIAIGIFLILALVATLFPPFEWNHFKEGIKDGGSREREPVGTYYIYHSMPIKNYNFLFSYNQKEFYSDVTERNETFTRSIILPELLVEYILIGLALVFLQLILHKNDKKKL